MIFISWRRSICWARSSSELLTACAPSAQLREYERFMDEIDKESKLSNKF